MELGELIRELRKKRGFTQRQLAQLAGISNTEVKRIEDGKRKQPSQEILKKLAKPLGISYEEILKAAGYYIPSSIPDSYPVGEFTKVPIYGEIRAGNPTLAQEEIIGYEYIPSDELRGGEYFYLRVKGDSMINARIQDGDLVLVRKQPTLEDGQIGVFLIDNEATIKRFRRQGNMAILMPENPAYRPILVPLENLTIIGEVVEAKIKFNGR